MRRLSVMLALAPVAAPSTALAQEQIPPPSLQLAPEKVGRAGAVIAGRTWRVKGQLLPAAPAARATITFRRGSATLRKVVVEPDATGAFAVDFRTRRGGLVRVVAETDPTPTQAALRSNELRVSVLRRMGPGSRGGSVNELQRLLARKGYVVGRRGTFDARTARAVMAFRKVTGMRRSFAVDRHVLAALVRGRGTFRVRFPRHGRHVEADISRQVMVFASGAQVQRIYHISSGAPATPTIRGSFRVYLRTPGTNSKGMVFSSYFRGGYAIHGYASVPPYNASHGCLRVPVPDAVSIYRWIRRDTRVDTFL